MNTLVLNALELAMERSPALSRTLAGTLLRVASPFNAPLRANVLTWDPTLCRLQIPNRRVLHNHLRGVHAGALVTAGESAAGLMLLRSFPFSRYRLILKDLTITFQRQARTDLVAEASQPQEEVDRIRAGLDRGEPQVISLETRISEPSGERLSVVRTTWQVKSWDQVRSRA